MVLYKNVLILLCVFVFNGVNVLLSSDKAPGQRAGSRIVPGGDVVAEMIQTLRGQHSRTLTEPATVSIKRKTRVYKPNSDQVVIAEMVYALQVHNSTRLKKICKREIMARARGSENFESVMSVLALKGQAEKENRQLQIDKNR